jgi:peptidyl-prolyl cis-trans isomerase D
MLEVIRKGQRWVTALFVIGIGGVFVFFLGLGGPMQGPGGGSVVEVGEHRFGLREFERVRARRENDLRQALGDQFDARQYESTLDQFASQVLIERAILAMEGDAMGLAVAKSEIENLARASFRGPDGRFDQAVFEDQVEYEWGNQRNFINEQRVSLLASKMALLIHGSARVSEGEVREALSQRLEEVRIAFVVIDAAEPPEGFEVADADIPAFLAGREAEAQSLYDARTDVYNTPEQTRARHILLRAPAGASEEEIAAVEERITAIRARIEGGEEFAALAGELSEDPGSKANGGDLGFFRRGQMVGPFEDVAFALEPGTLSDVVKTDFGFHLIQVEERREPESRSFAEVREEIARELLEREAGRAEGQSLADRLAEAVSGGASLEAAARDEELTLERSGWIKRRADGFVPGLGPAKDLITTAFTLAPGASSDAVFEIGDRLALVQLVERQEAPAPEIEAQLETETQRLLNEKRNAQLETWIASRRVALIDAGQIAVNLDAVR